MKSRLHKIEIQNFKAFRQFSLNLEGRHLLLYGPNGSGKSSLYWALYTFLQSAEKSTEDVAKYFDPAGNQKLLNIHEDPTVLPGRIAVTLRDSLTKDDTVYPISKDDHGTHNQPPITKGNLASDFVTYRFFFGFSNFKNSERFDLWSLFEAEILPFCISRGGTSTPLQQWKRIKGGVANPWASRGTGGANAYANFRAATDRFATTLKTLVSEIGVEAQKFYDKHFSDSDPAPIKIAFGVTRDPSFAGADRPSSVFRKPIVELHIEAAGKVIKRPQSFLNEAKLTQLALSVRFAASLVNLHESDLKLLVLDDLLVSLDMNNRMKVVEILLTDPDFANYQKVILTHDYGFFREFQRSLGSFHSDWHMVRLEGTPSTAINCHSIKSDLQKAEEYLHGHNLDEAALCLRKACEDTAKRFIDQAEVVPNKEFQGLADALRGARNRVLAGFPSDFYEKIVRNTPEQHRDRLVATNDDDLDMDTTLEPATRGRLKTNRNRLRTLLGDEQIERLRQVRLIDDILACTERVLNPAAHSGAAPLYRTEVQDALNLVRQLETDLLA